MGRSEFVDNDPLPSVPMELQTISSQSHGQSFLNSTFTLAILCQILNLGMTISVTISVTISRTSSLNSKLTALAAMRDRTNRTGH